MAFVGKCLDCGAELEMRCDDDALMRSSRESVELAMIEHRARTGHQAVTVVEERVEVSK